MAGMDEDLRKRLLARFGPTLDLEARPEILSEILTEIGRESFDPRVAGYQKTYTEGYNKEGYSRANYSRYDRTDDLAALVNRELVEQIRPEFDSFIVDRLREQLQPGK